MNKRKGKAVIEVECYPDGIRWKLKRGIQLTEYEKQVLKTRQDLMEYVKKKYANNPEKLKEYGVPPLWRKLRSKIVEYA